ncbi:MAG: hypothetical protein ACREPQ_01030, partial [Rhodanobacter sp.]
MAYYIITDALMPPPPPPVTCTPSSSTIPVTQTASCPAGYMTNTGATSFTQSGTATVATTCPAGIYG